MKMKGGQLHFNLETSTKRRSRREREKKESHQKCIILCRRKQQKINVLCNWSMVHMVVARRVFFSRHHRFLFVFHFFFCFPFFNNDIYWLNNLWINYELMSKFGLIPDSTIAINVSDFISAEVSWFVIIKAFGTLSFLQINIK